MSKSESLLTPEQTRAAWESLEASEKLAVIAGMVERFGGVDALMARMDFPSKEERSRFQLLATYASNKRFRGAISDFVWRSLKGQPAA